MRHGLLDGMHRPKSFDCRSPAFDLNNQHSSVYLLTRLAWYTILSLASCFKMIIFAENSFYEC